MWHMLRMSLVLSVLTSIGWLPTVRLRNSPSMDGLNGSLPTMHITRGASGLRNESEGHSTNLVKLYRKASFTGYSTVSTFSGRALGAEFEKSQQTMMKTVARRIRSQSTLATNRLVHPDSPSLRFRMRILVIET